jgi:hypothetical protein
MEGLPLVISTHVRLEKPVTGKELIVACLNTAGSLFFSQLISITDGQEFEAIGWDYPYGLVLLTDVNSRRPLEVSEKGESCVYQEFLVSLTTSYVLTTPSDHEIRERIARWINSTGRDLESYVREH